jgi:hypothetical protein
MFEPNAKTLKPASVPYRPLDTHADVPQTGLELLNCVRALFAPMTSGVKEFVYAIIDAANGRYDR